MLELIYIYHMNTFSLEKHVLTFFKTSIQHRYEINNFNHGRKLLQKLSMARGNKFDKPV